MPATAMASEIAANSLSKHRVLILLLLLLVSSVAQCSSHCKFPDESLSASSTIKGMFVFGSSLVDNGNNNFLSTVSNADYLPYGVDFPFGPSGRFTNGKNVVDLFIDRLGFPSYTPPFLDPSTKGPKIAYGVNFASGGSGIMDDTGSILVRWTTSTYTIILLTIISDISLVVV